jgi:hypothetical protein
VRDRTTLPQLGADVKIVGGGHRDRV